MAEVLESCGSCGAGPGGAHASDCAVVAAFLEAAAVGESVVLGGWGSPPGGVVLGGGSPVSGLMVRVEDGSGLHD